MVTLQQPINLSRQGLKGFPVTKQFFNHTQQPLISVPQIAFKGKRQVLRPVCFKEGEEEVETKETTIPTKTTQTRGISSVLSAGYMGLALLWTGMGMAMLIAPQMIAEKLLKVSLFPEGIVFMRLAGATNFPVAAAMFTLQEGAQKGALEKPTYRRLNLGIILSSVIMAVLQLTHWEINNVLNAGLCVGVGVIASGVCGCGWIANLKGEGGLLKIAEGWLAAFQNVFNQPNRQSVLYTVFMSMIVAMVGLQFVMAESAKDLLFPAGSAAGVNLYIKHVVAVGLLFSAVIMYSLKAAADKQQLYHPAFAKLNLGLGIMGATQFGVLLTALLNNVAATSMWLRWMLAAMAAFTIFTSSTAFVSQKQA
eukprot:TRINITY_DN8440_c0_g1_i1.p2 TRINITY_DN8440_c0_g1~~TRINITY_DN8440_c0_g1_i1.p2  ORF type:complete len:373 (+),score=52.60 TRINITY_DN8440_c0_g1_i1:26-1120(+)